MLRLLLLLSLLTAAAGAAAGLAQPWCSRPGPPSLTWLAAEDHSDRSIGVGAGQRASMTSPAARHSSS